MAVGDNPPFIVMQYYEEGSLFDVLKKAQRNKKYAMKFNIERRLNVLIGVAKGMVFLHNQQETILHRFLLYILLLPFNLLLLLLINNYLHIVIKRFKITKCVHRKRFLSSGSW